MKTEEFRFHTYGSQIYGCFTQPEKVKGVVVLVHGFGEHSGRYSNNIIPVLLSLGLAVIRYDNVGHGKSSGKRGHCPSYLVLLDILEHVIIKAQDAFSRVPFFLYGHSMGGNLVLNYVLRRKMNIRGVIATSPYLRLAFQPPAWKMVLGKLMLGLIPSITLPSGLDANGISRISEEVEKYNKDPLIHDKVSPMYSFPIMDAGEWAIANASQLTVDTLLMHGTADQIIDFKATQEFHQNSNKTTLKLFEGGFHELHNDLCSDEMLRELSKWFSTIISNPQLLTDNE